MQINWDLVCFLIKGSLLLYIEFCKFGLIDHALYVGFEWLVFYRSKSVSMIVDRYC